MSPCRLLAVSILFLGALTLGLGPGVPMAEASGGGPNYTNVQVAPRTYDLWEDLFGDWIDWTGYTPWDFQNCFDDWTAVMSGSTKPLPAFNCDENHYQGEALIGVQTNGFPSDLARTADLRRLATQMIAAGVLTPGTGLHTLFTNGSLVAVEIDWWSPANGFIGPAPSEVQGEVTALHAPNHNGDAVLLGYIVGYDAAQWAAREAVIEGMIGHPMREFRMWTNPAIAHCKTKGKLDLNGSGNTVWGDLESNHAVRINGSDNTFHHDIRHLHTFTNQGSNNTWGALSQETNLPIPPAPFSESWARAEAQASGAYHSGNLTVTSSSQLPSSGIVFCEGRLIIDCSDLTGTWTFVSASNKVCILGSSCDLTPAVAGVCLISFARDVIVDGSSHTLRGGLWAPTDRVMLQGSGNRIEGGMVGQKINLNGSDNEVTNGLDPNPGT